MNADQTLAMKYEATQKAAGLAGTVSIARNRLLADVLDFAEECQSYVPEFFADKWDLTGERLERMKTKARELGVKV